jgi:hypothetical protein
VHGSGSAARPFCDCKPFGKAAHRRLRQDLERQCSIASPAECLSLRSNRFARREPAELLERNGALAGGGVADLTAHSSAMLHALFVISPIIWLAMRDAKDTCCSCRCRSRRSRSPRRRSPSPLAGNYGNMIALPLLVGIDNGIQTRRKRRSGRR